MPVLDDRDDSAAHRDDAVFAPTRVRGPRGPRALASIVVVALGALVAIGALERQPTAETSSVDGRTNGPVAIGPVRPTATVLETGRTVQRSNRFTNDPIVPTFDLDVRQAGSHLFIHGDVFSLAVARVSVTLEDEAGNISATKAVEVPGGSTAFRLGAVPRFDIHFFLPDEVAADGFVVLATALDSAGHPLATTEERVPRSQVSL